jgi:hypothetical protein
MLECAAKLRSWTMNEESTLIPHWRYSSFNDGSTALETPKLRLRNPTSIDPFTAFIGDPFFNGYQTKDFDMRDMGSALYKLTSRTSAGVERHSLTALYCRHVAFAQHYDQA